MHSWSAKKKSKKKRCFRIIIYSRRLALWCASPQQSATNSAKFSYTCTTSKVCAWIPPLSHAIGHLKEGVPSRLSTVRKFRCSLTSKGWPVSMTALCRNFIPRRHKKLCWAGAPCEAVWSNVVSSYTLETDDFNLSRNARMSLKPALISLLKNIHTWFGCQLRVS